MAAPDFEVRCPECFTDVSRGAPCSVCNDGGRCCPCVHEDDPATSECVFPGTNHSDDEVTVWHGAAVPLLLCGYHASRTGEPGFYEMVLGARDPEEAR